MFQIETFKAKIREMPINSVIDYKDFKFITGRDDNNKVSLGLFLTADNSVSEKLISGITSISYMEIEHYLMLNNNIQKTVFKADTDTAFMAFPTQTSDGTDAVGVVVKSSRMPLETLNLKMTEIIKCITTVK